MARYKAKKLPRLANGKVNMDAPPLRTADGKIDLSGFWMPTQIREAPAEPCRRPEARRGAAAAVGRCALQGAHREEREGSSGVRCLPSGIPEKLNIPDGLKVIQTPDVMLFLFESRTIYRQVFTDGRPLPPEDVQPDLDGLFDWPLGG